MSQSTKGIVLSKDFFGEADLYITFMTRDWGVVSLLAKSARKSRRRFAGGMDLFCHNEIFVKGDPKENGLLLELSVLNSFSGIREMVERALTAGKVTQWTKKLLAHAPPVPSIYSLLGQTLALIENETSEPRLELLALIFKKKILTELGITPRFDRCAKCDGDLGDLPLFEIAAGGMLCPVCASHNHFAEYYRIEKVERTFLESVGEVKMTKTHEITFPSTKVAILSKILTGFGSYHTQTRLP